MVQQIALWIKRPCERVCNLTNNNASLVYRNVSHPYHNICKATDQCSVLISPAVSRHVDESSELLNLARLLLET